MDKIIRILSKYYNETPRPLAEAVKLRDKEAFFILVSTILSARTRDETTERVCKELFKKVRKPRDLARVDLEKIIKPVNYYKTKSKHLRALAGLKEIPSEIDELIELPGVGRKTANIVRNVAFGLPSIAVDTHVHRISNRLGYVMTKTPKETEFALRDKLPKKYWSVYNLLLVMHGQNTCTPRNPKCSACPISKYCKRVGVKKSK